MRKIVALLLSAVLLLSACAFAEEAAAANCYRLSDVAVRYGETNIDLTGVALELDVAQDGSALLLHLDSNGESAAEIGFTRVDGLDVMHISGSLTGHKDFVTDPVAQVEKVLKAIISGAVEALQGLDTQEIAANIVSFIDNPAPALEQVSELAEEAKEDMAAVPEDAGVDLASISFEGDFLGALEACVTKTEGVEVEGGSGIPAGTYDVNAFFADEDTLASLLDMVLENGEPLGLGEQLREAGVNLALSVTMYAGDPTTAVDVALTTAHDDETYSGGITVSNTADEAGDVTAVDLHIDNDGEPANLRFTLSKLEREDMAFTADSVDLASAVNLDEATDEEAASALSEAASSLMSDAMLILAAPVMSAAMANVDFSALQEQAGE